MFSRYPLFVFIAYFLSFSTYRRFDMRIASLFVSIAFLTSSGNAATVIVPYDYPTIQDAIIAVADEDTVIVRQGTYVENINFLGKLITVRSTDPFDPAVVANTIIDGNSAGSVVTFASGEGDDSALAGFTIKNGIGTPITIAPWLDGRAGGGIVCIDSEPTISYNIIMNNVADFGAGIFCSGAELQPVISHNTIKENEAIQDVDWVGGGGIYSWGCSPWIHHNTICDNEAFRIDPPAEFAYWGHGGGVYCTSASSAIVEYNEIYENMSEIGGGLCDRYSSSSIFRKNTIRDNQASGDSGGISINRECTTHVISNIIYSNSCPHCCPKSE